MRFLLMRKRESETLCENDSNLVKQNGFRMTPKAVKQRSVLFGLILNRAFCPYRFALFWGMKSLGFFFLAKDGEVDVALGMLAQVVQQRVCALDGGIELVVERGIVHQEAQCALVAVHVMRECLHVIQCLVDPCHGALKV